jgi:hypothetical protein
MNKSVKGKQATRGEKQILVENESTIKYYMYVFGISNGAYFLLRFLFFWETFTALYMTLFGVTLSLSGGAYYFISYMGRPLRDETGAVIGAGTDLNMPGHISEYAKDIILFTAIVYALAAISDYFWFLLIVAPLYVFFLLWKNVLGPWFFAPAPEQEPEQDQKKVKEKRKVIRR